MFILTFKLNKQKILMIILILLIIGIIAGLGYKMIQSNSIKTLNQTPMAIDYEKEKDLASRFIESYGWKVEKASVQKEEFQMPKDFDTLYKKYNQYQKDVGLDLNSYVGKIVRRYTFKVLNYENPSDFKGQQVYADALVYDGKVIAGDLKTNQINGFMVSMKNRTFKEITGIDEWMFK